MKLTAKLILGISIAAALPICQIRAAQSERLLTIALTGFLQDQNSIGDDVAVPFRVTTKDILQEITLATGTNVNGGVLLLIESLDETNALSRIVARTRAGEVDVTDLFEINQGTDVRTSRFSGNTFKSATFYAIDHFLFSTIDADGIELTVQGFTKETQRASVKRVGGSRINVTSSKTKSDGNGELQSANGFIGPVKGNISVGTPRFFESAAGERHGVITTRLDPPPIITLTSQKPSKP